MGRVLVTVIGPRRRADLALPAEATVAELIPELVELCVDPPQRHDSARWALGSLGKEPFPPGRVIADLGVPDGALLQLRDMASPAQGQPSADPHR